MAAYLEIPLELAVERIAEEPENGVAAAVNIESATIDHAAIGANAPGWERGTPTKDDAYFYRETASEAGQLCNVVGAYAHFLNSSKSLRWLAAQRPNAQWARIARPGEWLPASVDVARLDAGDRANLQRQAEQYGS